ncbi:hypothetical protein EUTSA_v10012047mg [Eutrema salsugineum]|uniref:F-box associated beta-propeller type 3 domain-containing protein n=1 Tax=Eutrema salsugineum TaxID=72664 RepID=V4KT41_EUTSA|nr:hypothetical protein EUTSA_v10012047mg [Eutrema salsugineum]
MLLRPYFTDLFLTRSSAWPPRLLFAVQIYGDKWCFFTSSQPQNPYDEESSSLVATADCHMKFLGDEWLETCGYASGLICFRGHTAISEDDNLPVLCNPSTGQFASLPLPKCINCWRSFLGFDPIDKQFKILFVSYPKHYEDDNQVEILTLGTGNDSWKKIHALSEKFKFIHRDFIRYQDRTELINYKGNLGVITRPYSTPGTRGQLCFSIIKDVEKPEPEWSEDIYSFWENQFPKCVVYDFWEYLIVGVTATGGIVFSMQDTSKRFYIFFFNPERNTLVSVEIQGFGAANHGTFQKRSRSVRVFVDYAEDLKFISMKTTYNAATSSPPKQKRSKFQSL